MSVILQLHIRKSVYLTNIFPILAVLLQSPQISLNMHRLSAYRQVPFVSSCRALATAGSSRRQKIVVKNPVVDLDGDEMTRIIWQEIKNKVSVEIFLPVLFDV